MACDASSPHQPRPRQRGLPQNRDPINDFPAAAPFIANVYVKDLKPFQPGVRPEFVPAGEGIIDYHAFEQSWEISI
jgi:sugar phosphate isomerase/epimerase